MSSRSPGARASLLAAAIAAGILAVPGAAKATEPVTLAATSPATAIALDGGSAWIALRATEGRAAGSAAGRARLVLILRGLRTEEQPGVTYGVYVDVPTGTRPPPGDPRRIGTMNFFNAATAPVDVSYELPEWLASRLSPGSDVTVAVIADGQAAEDATPTLASVALVGLP
jgi:tyrosinase